ncbi:MAG: hypothetical protein ACI9KE_001987 [Polyangiales bacterium]|jgi:hypothetical protein
MRAIAAGFTIFFAIVGVSFEAKACDCNPPSLERALETSDVIFEGQIQSLSETGATFRITQQWKGLSDLEELEIDTGPGTCGFSFTAGEIYLVFASQEEGRLRTNICDRTALVSAAEADLMELGPGVVPVDPGTDPEPELETPPAEGCAVLTPGASEGGQAFLFAMGFALLMRRRRCP